MLSSNLIILKSILIFILSFFLTSFFIKKLRLKALTFGILDSPDGKLKQQTFAVPYFGGLAVFLGFTSTLLISVLFLNNKFTSQIYWFFFGIIVLLITGLIDDLISLKPLHKLIGQIISAIIFIIGGIYFESSMTFLSIIISFLWFCTITNAFNLVDVMDGLATTIAIMVTFSFAFFSITFGQYNLFFLLITFIGSLFSFLMINKPPAKMYLGDTGSLLIGGILGILPFLLKGWSNYNKFGFIIPIVILGIPLLELFTLIIIRFYKKIPIYLGSPDHFSIYLQKKGWNKKSILYYVVFCNLFLLLVSWFFYINLVNIYLLFILGFFFLVFWVFVLFY